jgi:hypothetical protein
MASDFSVTWQCLSKRTIVFFITDQTPRPSWDTYWGLMLWSQFSEILPIFGKKLAFLSKTNVTFFAQN